VLSQALDSAQLHAREQLRRRERLCVEELMRCSEFAARQSVEIDNARADMDRAERAAADAQLIVRERFQRVSVMEKLLERKVAEGVRLALQSEQKRMDDDALLRVGPKSSETEK
jgi:flagellar export protein FliJ